MRVPDSEHASHPWLIARIAPDFRLVDAWALPARGRHDEFDVLLNLLGSLEPAETGSAASRALFAVRFRVGRWLGWDDATKKRHIPGCEETTLRARVPDDLRGETGPPIAAAYGFVPLYRTGEEFAAEIANETVHGVLHLAWVPEGDGRYRGRMAIYVKPRGMLGEIYMKVIEPFRRHIVYPALMRRIARSWNDRTRRDVP